MPEIGESRSFFQGYFSVVVTHFIKSCQFSTSYMCLLNYIWWIVIDIQMNVYILLFLALSQRAKRAMRVERINVERICDCFQSSLILRDESILSSRFDKDEERKVSITQEKLITLRFQLEKWWRDLVRIFTEGGKLDFMGEAHSNETSIFNDLLWPIAFSPAVAILWLILEAGILSYWLANKMCLATGKEYELSIGFTLSTLNMPLLTLCFSPFLFSFYLLSLFDMFLLLLPNKSVDY